LQNAGLNIDASLISTTGKTLSGGVNTADSAWGYRFSLGITADLEKLLDIKGGTAFLNFRSMDGKRDSLDGAFQVTSLAYSPLRNQISELWYSQKLLNDQLLVKAGKIDANNDFAFVANASEFANSSMCNSLTILGMPTNPDPAMGTDLFFHPTSNLYAGAGMFDGSLEQGISTGSRGPSTLFEHSLFFIGEFGTTWSTSAHQDGRLGIGAWGHTGQFARYSGGTDDGTAGAYLVLDQTIWRKHPEIDGDTQGVFAYLQYGYADPQVSPVQDHFGAGATWVGLMDWRKNDILGLAATYVEFTNVRSAGYSGGGELDVELFYKVVVTPWLSIKPDIQFVRNPGGVRDRPDALAASIQTTVTF
jgi:porin